jgi:prepilin-type processing-associated H-X9-DG protein
VIDEGQCSYSYAQGLVDDGDEAQAIMSDSLVSGRSPHGRAGFNVSYVDGHGRWETAPPLLNNRVDPIYPSDDAYLAKANSVELWEDLKLVIWGAVFAAVSIIWVGAVVRRWKLRRDLSFLR